MTATLGPATNHLAIDTAAIKQRIDLLALIGRDTQLRKAASTRGGEYEGACTFCGGRDRLRVQPERGLWWCRQCGGDRWSDAIGYIMRRDSSTFPEACAALGGAPAILPRATQATTAVVGAVALVATEEPSAEWRARAEAFVVRAEAALWSDAGTGARDWLHGRGLTDETLHRWQLGYQPADAWDEPAAWGLDGGKRICRPRGIVIPWRLNGQLWQSKVRRPDGEPRYVAVRGGHPLIFGAETLTGHDTAVLTEGELDAMLLEQEAGDLVGVATLGSCSKGLDARAIGYLLPVSRLLLAYDTDAGGTRGADRLGALSARARRVRVPVGKDITEFWQQGGTLRDWVTFELARMAALAPIAVAVDVPAVAPTPAAQPETRPIAIQWGRERGWLAVRDPWGEWHELPARGAPSGWVAAAKEGRR